MITIERLEMRDAPGGLTASAGTPDNDSLLVMAEAGGAVQRYPVDVPKETDLAVIGTQPSRFLDAAHDAIPRKIPERDANGVNSLNDSIDEFFFRKGTPINLVIVATSTPGGSGFILGRNYFYAAGHGSDSAASQSFWDHCRAKIDSVLVIVSGGDQKAELFQQTADMLTGGGIVTVQAYSGLMGVNHGPPVHFETTGDLLSWKSQ